MEYSAVKSRFIQYFSYENNCARLFDHTKISFHHHKSAKTTLELSNLYSNFIYATYLDKRVGIWYYENGCLIVPTSSSVTGLRKISTE